MTAQEFVRRAVSAAADYRTLYVSGGFGAPLVGRNVERYCTNNAYNRAQARQALIRAAGDQSPPVYGWDCVGLIKGLLWGWTGDPSKTYGGARYDSNGVPDIGEDEMIRRCAGVSADFSGIRPGAAVWMPGHIGIYIGDGLAVESSPKWANGAQITAVGDLGTVPGYNARTWKKWGLLPYVDYEEDETVTYEQWKVYMDRYQKELSEVPDSKVPDWAKREMQKAKDLDICDGSRPMALITRAEVASMCVRTKGG